MKLWKWVVGIGVLGGGAYLVQRQIDKKIYEGGKDVGSTIGAWGERTFGGVFNGDDDIQDAEFEDVDIVLDDGAPQTAWGHGTQSGSGDWRTSVQKYIPGSSDE
jgi:hypothetical protein